MMKRDQDFLLSIELETQVCEIKKTKTKKNKTIKQLMS